MAGISWNDHKGAPERARRSVSVGAVTAILAMLLPTAAGADEPTVPVIVRADAEVTAEVAALVEAAGGVVDERFASFGGFAGDVPVDLVPEIAGMPGVISVTSDVQLLSLSTRSATITTDARETKGDPRSVRSSATALGVDQLWARGIDGSGVDVAVVDSGVQDSVAFSGRLAHGPDLSFESGSDDTRHTDTFGHGTHLAGIIAGEDAASGFQGVAPGAGIVSVKVADRNGLTDVSQVMAAIDWVVQHRDANGMNIRVLNLAFGTNGAQSHTLDPLAYAAEVAWQNGITVVVAAGNEGAGLGRLNNPATDPNLLAVGAVDIAGTATTSDDTVPSWSSRGDGRRNPDVVAPGVSVPSVKATGSRADERNPKAHVGDRLIKGSGTSQSTAFVSGVAALLYDLDPNTTPDAIKLALTATAESIPGAQATAVGRGLLQPISAAKTLSRANRVQQKHDWGTGRGSIEAARGDAHVVRDGVVLEGEHTVFGEYDADEWSGSTWSGSTWSGSTWSGSTWSGGSWLGSTWSGSTWSGSTWSGSTWSGSTWSGSTWSGSTWSGSTWSGHTWSTASWG